MKLTLEIKVNWKAKAEEKGMPVEQWATLTLDRYSRPPKRQPGEAQREWAKRHPERIRAAEQRRREKEIAAGKLVPNGFVKCKKCSVIVPRNSPEGMLFAFVQGGGTNRGLCNSCK